MGWSDGYFNGGAVSTRPDSINVDHAMTLVNAFGVAVNLVESIAEKRSTGNYDNIEKFIGTPSSSLLDRLYLSLWLKTEDVLEVEHLGQRAHKELESVSRSVGADRAYCADETTPLGKIWKSWKASATVLEDRLDHSSVSGFTADNIRLKEVRRDTQSLLRYMN